MSATIGDLKHHVAILQRLLDARAPPISTQHTCRAVSCKKSFGKLEHLYRHIRDQKKNPTHEPLADIINETHCVLCSRTCGRPCDLVKHEKQFHGETYVSRLDKFMGIAMPPSPPSSTSAASEDVRSRWIPILLAASWKLICFSSDVDEESFRKTKWKSRSNHMSSRRPLPSPPGQIASSMKLARVQPIRRISPNRSTGDTSVPERSESDLAFVHTSPMVVEPTASWASRDQIPPTFEHDSTSTPSVFPVPLDLPELDSWDRFYDEHGFLQWDGFYTHGNHLVQWDNFYVGRNDLLQNVGRDGYTISPAQCLPPTESDSSHSRGDLSVSVHPLDDMRPAPDCAGGAGESG